MFLFSPHQNEEISKHIKNAIRKEKLAKEYKRHVNSDISAQSRVIKKISSNKNRYNIVSQFRAKQLDKIDEIADEEAEASKKDDKTKEAEGSEKSEKLFCLYDMEQEYITQNQVRVFIMITRCSYREALLKPHSTHTRGFPQNLGELKREMALSERNKN